MDVYGSPVQFVSVPEVGVPRIGVTSVGVVANTKEPVPVSSVTAARKFVEVGVPKNVATPVAKLVMDVYGSPVQFVSVPEVGVPRIGVTSVGVLDNTTLPEPVDVVVPVPPTGTERVLPVQYPKEFAI